jgi:hypothetical protein
MKIYPVPAEFQPTPVKSYYNYPIHNSSVDTLVEESAHRFMIDAPDIPEVEYLPIYWSAYHVSTGYGKNSLVVGEFIKNLPRDRKFFTVCQYDDGTLVGDYCENRNVVVFGAGGIGDVPIPLLCAPHPVEAKPDPLYFAAFVGSEKTHPIRSELKREFEGRSDCFYGSKVFDSQQLRFFRDTMRDTLFALCPRGYGKTSFRLYEAIQIGCLPVVVYDKPWLPFEDVFDWNNFAILCHRSEISGLYNRLKAISAEKIMQMRINLAALQSLFTVEITAQYVHDRMRKWQW